MKESAIEILHHNRDRYKLIEQNIAYIESLMNEDIAIALMNFNNFYSVITPEDETQVVIDNYKQYIDPIKAKEDTTCIYSLSDTSTFLNQLLNELDEVSVLNNSFLKNWLNNRGVTDQQITKWKLIDLSKLANYPSDKKNIAGASIHPALRNWIPYGKTIDWIPQGIMIPVFNLDNQVIGCHNRFLSTVPMIKFASSIPNFHLFTNLRNDSKVEKIYIVEGAFDALAIDLVADDKTGWISPSSGYWCEEQLINLISMLQNFPKAQIITMFDNDRVGIKSNVLLYLTLNSITINTIIMNFPEYAKDASEAICKYKMSLDDLEYKDFKELKEQYMQLPYEEYRPFEDYMDSRHASYSIDNYDWKQDE